MQIHTLSRLSEQFIVFERLRPLTPLPQCLMLEPRRQVLAPADLLIWNF